MEQMVDNFFPYSQKKLGFEEPVTIIFQSDEDNASKMLGKTAYYDPQAFEVVLYIDKRHPKDVLRSLSHELVHHAQNCRGDFTSDSATYEGYAQNDPHLRKMEREAYTKGNLIFRDFEDLIKTGKINIEIDFSDSGEPEMSLKEWKNNERTRLLMEKWGYRQKGAPEKKLFTEGWGYRDEDDDDPTGRTSRRHDNPLKALSPKDYEDIGSKEHDDEEGNRPSMAKDMDLKEDSEGEETYHYGEAEGHDEKELHDLVRRHATKAHIDALKRDMDYDEDHEDRREHGDHFREGADKWAKMADAPEDPTDAPTATALQQKRTKKRGEWGKVRGKSDIRGKRDTPVAAGSKNVMTMGEDAAEELEEGDPLMKLTPKGHRDTETSSDKRLDYEKDPAAHMTQDQALKLGLSPDTVRSAVDWDPTAEHPDDRRDTRQPSRGGHQVGLGTARRRWRKAFAGQFREGKISIREAKEITRRITERIKKESN